MGGSGLQSSLRKRKCTVPFAAWSGCAPGILGVPAAPRSLARCEGRAVDAPRGPRRDRRCGPSPRRSAATCSRVIA